MTYISGRRSFNTDDSGLFLLLTNLIKMNEVVSDTEENSLLCYTGLASCLSTASLVALKDENVEETDILSLLVEGLVEYSTDSDIKNTWTKLRTIKHIPITVKCLQKYKSC